MRIVHKAVKPKIIVTKSMFYARMMRAQGYYVYGPYHNDKIYIHKHKVKLPK